MHPARIMPACVLAAVCVAVEPAAAAGEQQATFAVAVRLHAVAKIPSARELCAADAPLDARTLQTLGVAVRVDCPPPTAEARTSAPRAAAGERARPPEVLVSF